MATVEKVHGVVDPLVKLLVPVDSLTLLPGNARKGDVQAVAASLQKYGQRKPLVGRKDGTITAGNHTLLAARGLGWTHVAAVLLDDDDLTAKGFALADNRTHDLGAYDDRALADLLSEVQAGEALDGTGYTDADLAALLASLAEQDDPPGSKGLGDNALISFGLIFENEHQQAEWYAFVRLLRALYDEETLGARIQAYVEHLRERGDLDGI